MGIIDSIWQRAWQSDEAQKERNYNKSMWDKQQEYNTPANQMQRYRDAGLNPSLMYGQGNPGNASGASPGYTRANPTMSADLNPLNMLNQYADFKVKSAQARNIEENTTLTSGKALTEKYNAMLAEAKAKMTDGQFKDFSNKMQITWGTGSMLTPDTPGVKSVLSGVNKEVSEAAIKKLEEQLKEQGVKWAASNNLSKWIPMLQILSKIF